MATPTLTFLFTDIEGSTTLLRRLGAVAYADALAEHHRLVRTALAAHGGEEIDTQGDGFFAVFTSPRACATAVIEMQQALVAQKWHAGERVRVRMGVHSGEALATTTGLVGLDVHRAARVAAVAHGGQIVLSLAAAVLVRDNLPPGASLRELGVHRLKDLGRPEQLFQLQAEGLRADFPSLRSLDNPALPNNLPAQPSSFIGRVRELSELRSLVDSSRLVTVTGAGGSGKTRLALQVAAQLLDGSGEGVWLVELASVSDEEAVASTIADVLGTVRRRDQSALDALLESLASQRMLIMLDNCEHLIGACAKVAEALLRGCPQMHLLATSREPLGITGERIYRIPGLSLPGPGESGADLTAETSDAVALFVDRAAAQGARLELDGESTPIVTRICRGLDGMPLAIELAASRLRALSLASLHDRLDQRFRLLTGGSRSALPRQQTLLATVEWSYSLLNLAEKNLLGRLSVFIDGFDLEAAEGICGFGDIDGFAVTSLLTSLVDKSLVVAEPERATVRYRLLETIRQFAAERLAECGDSVVAELQEAHCRYFLSFAEQAAMHLDRHEQVLWLHRLDADQGNVRRAMEYAAGAPDVVVGTARVLRFGAALDRYWLARNRRDEAVGLLMPVLARSEAQADPPLRAAALATAALATRRVDLSGAQQLAEEAMEIATRVGDDGLLIEAGATLCCIYYFAGMPERGFPLGEAAVERARRPGNEGRLGRSLVHFLLCSDRLVPEATEELTAEAVACVERMGDEILAATLHNNAGVYRVRDGDLIGARRHLERSQRAYRACGRDHGVVHINLGWVLREEGDGDGSCESFEQALRVSRRTGEASLVAYAMLGLACLAGDCRNWNRSALLHGFADALLSHVGEPWQDPEDRYQQQSLDRARSALGDTVFQRTYEDGSRLEQQAAVDLALNRN